MLLKELHSQNFAETEEVVTAAFHTLRAIPEETLAPSKKTSSALYVSLLFKKEENAWFEFQVFLFLAGF